MSGINGMTDWEDELLDHMKEAQKVKGNGLVYLESLKYQNLFEFFNTEHGLILTMGEMDDVIHEVERFKKEYNEAV